MKHSIAHSHYQKPPWWIALLKPLSWCYELIVKLRILAYRFGLIQTVRVNVPVISVGNLTTGGTGKTPIIMALAENLIASGKKVVILSRGYGAKTPIQYGQPQSANHGDEAWLIQKHLPEAIVVVGKNRSQNALKAIEEHQPDIILLDDGYQHIKLERDVNILLVDGYQMMGNGLSLPAGPMREPFNEIKRADALWVTKTRRAGNYEQIEHWRNQYARSPNIPMGAVLFESIGFRHLATDKILSLETLKGKKVLAFSGIASPTTFQQNIETLGAHITGHLIFPDHHNYTLKDVETLLKESHPPSGDSIPIVTTEKDRVKIENLLTSEQCTSIYTLIVRPVIPSDALPDTLKDLLSLDTSHVPVCK